MFCSACGVKNTTENANFCSSCGAKVEQAASSKNTTANKLTFEQFRSKKEEHRTLKFKNGKSAKKVKLDLQDVTIQVGLMASKDGELRIKRGSNLPLKVSPSITSKELKEKAVEKHSRFNGDIRNIPSGYKLLYTDKRPVDKMPGKEEEFVLKNYKEELGKAFSRITFYLSTNSDYFDHISSGLFGDDSGDLSSDDNLESQVNIHCFDTSNSASSTSTTNTATSTSTSNEKQDCNTPESARAIMSTCDRSDIQSLNVDEPSTSAVQCPICLTRFSLTEIEEHAESCSSWLVESDQPHELQNDDDDPMPVLYLPNPSEAKKKLKEQIEEMVTGSLTELTRLTVRRKFLWNDFKAARQKKIVPNSNLKVVFVGEPSVDDGGPKRELFTELLSIIQLKFFSSGYPITSVVALTNEDFRLCGEIMAMSILQGGPAPNFLAAGIANYILGKPLSTDEIKDQNLKATADKLINATTNEDIREALSSEAVLDVLEVIGYTSIPQKETTSSAKSIVQSICMKDQLSPYLPALLQILRGMDVCGLLKTIRQHPDVWEPVFTIGKTFNITADELLDELDVKYSPSQIEKDVEFDTFKYFCDAVEQLDRENGNLKLKDLIKWLTGSYCIPPLGFPKKFNVAFVHGCPQGCSCRPTASTCDTTIKLPVHINGEELMEEMLASAILESHGFGLL